MLNKNKIIVLLAYTFVSILSTYNIAYAEIKVDLLFTSDELVKYIENNPIGSFIILANKKICVKGEVGSIEENSLIVNTGLVYGKIIFKNVSENTVINVDIGKESYIIGNFMGYGLKESTLVFDKCEAYNEKPVVLNNSTKNSVEDTIRYYEKNKGFSFTGEASEIFATFYKSVESLFGGYYENYSKNPNLDNKNKLLKCYLDLIYSNSQGNFAKIKYNNMDIKTDINKIIKDLNNLNNREETKAESIEILTKDYEKNYKRANRTYENKNVVISGKISSIYGNLKFKRFIIELSSGWFGKFKCHFYSASFNSICNYKIGDSVTISGIPISNEDELSLYFCLIKDGEAESSLSNITEPNIENKKEESKSDQNVENKINYGISIGDKVNVRKSPSKSSAIVCQINKNNKVEILDKQQVEGDFWYKINFEENKNVWVSSRFIETNISNIPNLPTLPDENKKTNGNISGDRVNLRSDPSRNSKILGMAMKGVIINILEEKIIDNDVWYKIEYPELGVVWIISNYVEKN